MLAEIALAVTTTTTLTTGMWTYRLRRRLRTDPLTGLGNRLALADAFARARRRVPLLGVALGDMNGFKALNDTHGHRFGDRVLIEVAAILRHTAVSGELPVRLHGDEFAILIPCHTPEHATHRLDVYRTAVDRLDEVDGQPITASMALGVITAPSATAELSALLASADDRMYGDKHTTTSPVPIERTPHAVRSDSPHRQGCLDQPGNPARRPDHPRGGLADQPSVVHRPRPGAALPRQGAVRPAQAQ